MSHEISLLPEDLRKKEQELKKTATAAPAPVADLQFSSPTEEGDDIEVIEVDEGEVGQVLANEPLLSRVAYQVTNFFEEFKTKFFQPSVVPPPPKLPPQFFAPPPVKPKPVASPQVLSAAPTTPKPVPQVGTAQALVKPRTQIIPSAVAPRRVRVIKRVRKPVRVSFVSEEDLRQFRIDIPKRRFTFITAVIFFAVLIGGGVALLSSQLQGAQDGLSSARVQTAHIQQQIAAKQSAWSAFQDLEPRLKALGGLLDSHVSPTRLFDLIERQTLPTVSYGSFSLTPDNKVNLAVTADSLNSAAAQIVAFQQASFISKVDASNYNLTNGPNSTKPSGVLFQVTLTLSHEAMHAPALAVSP